MGRTRFQTAFVVFLLWVGRWVSGVGAWGRRLSVCRVSDLLFVPTMIAVSNHSYEPTTNWEECLALMHMHDCKILKI